MLFIEKQKYSSQIAYRIKSDKIDYVNTLVHNYADKSAALKNGVPFVRFKSEEHFVKCVELWRYMRLTGNRLRTGAGKGKNLWREAQREARQMEQNIPWASESFIKGVNIAENEHATTA